MADESTNLGDAQGRGDSVLDSLKLDGSVSSENEANRSLRMYSNGLKRGTVKVWKQPDRLVEKLSDAAEVIADCVTAKPETRMNALEFLRKLNADNAKHLANADRIELMRLAAQANLPPDPALAPQTVIVIESGSQVAIAAGGVQVQPPKPVESPRLGEAGGEVSVEL